MDTLCISGFSDKTGFVALNITGRTKTLKIGELSPPLLQIFLRGCAFLITHCGLMNHNQGYISAFQADTTMHCEAKRELDNANE